jgi:hypothetical protein
MFFPFSSFGKIVHDTLTAMNIHAQALGRKGGKARAAKLSKRRMSEIAALGGKARHANKLSTQAAA